MGREIALDLLEGFFPNREDVESLANRGIMHPDFINPAEDKVINPPDNKDEVIDPMDPNIWKEVDEETKVLVFGYFRDAHKDLFGDSNNPYFDLQPLIVHCCISFYHILYKRPEELEPPNNWLMDLYGLADEVRKRHRRMESAVEDLKKQLNVPPILADVVARDVLDELETVDPYLLQNDDNTYNIPDVGVEDDNDDDLQAKYDVLQAEMSEKMALIQQYEEKMQKYEQGKVEQDDEKLENESESVLDKLREEFARFKGKYNEENLRQTMQDEPSKLLDKSSELNQDILSYKQLISGVIESAKSFESYLENINGMIDAISTEESK